MLVEILVLSIISVAVYAGFQWYRNKNLLRFTDGRMVPRLEVSLSELKDFHKFMTKESGPSPISQVS
jgi:hypothetical protein